VEYNLLPLSCSTTQVRIHRPSPPAISPIPVEHAESYFAKMLGDRKERRKPWPIGASIQFCVKLASVTLPPTPFFSG
jgi:hypothetical protein